MKENRVIIVVVMTLMLIIPCLAWTAETIAGYMVELKNDSLVIRQKGGGSRTVQVNDRTALRFSRKDYVTSQISNIPRNSKMFVTVESGIATLVTVEEVPK